MREEGMLDIIVKFSQSDLTALNWRGPLWCLWQRIMVRPHPLV